MSLRISGMLSGSPALTANLQEVVIQIDRKSVV